MEIIKNINLIKDITGRKFGKLTVQELMGINYGANWKCICECGNSTIVNAGCLRKGSTKSCGCIRKELLKNNKRSVTHGFSRIPEYYAWVHMKQRCYNPKCAGFENYGSRGITVCDRWLNSFEDFIKDIGFRPTPHHSIDRIDNDGNYDPDNCKWSTKSEQGFNRRKRK